MNIYEFATKKKDGPTKTARMMFIKHGRCILYDKLTFVLQEINMDKMVDSKLRLSPDVAVPKYFILNEDVRNEVSYERFMEFKAFCKEERISVISPKTLPVIVAD